MPHGHLALHHLLKNVQAELTQVENRLSESVDADESTRLVDHAVDLQASVEELQNLLNSQSTENDF